MGKTLKKRGQKIIRRFSRASYRASENSKERIKENFLGRISHIKHIRLLIFEWCLLVSALIMLAITQSIWSKESYSKNSFNVGGTYTEATIGKINSLNPLFATTNSEKALSKLMFATLSTIDYSGNIGNGLTSYIKPSDDGKTWTIKLRDNLKWSDGEPITNKDVLFTASIITDPSVTTIYDANLSNVKITENENGEINFILPDSYADFDSALNFPIVPEHILYDVDPKTIIEHSFSTDPITSGAFTFNASQPISQDGEKIIYLSANSNYYKGKPLLSSFAIHAFLKKEDIINAINSGSVTGTAELSAVDESSITTNQFFKKSTNISSGVFAFFNTSTNNMKNKDLRKAIRQGIDLNMIREAAPNTTALDYPLIQSQIELSNYPTIPAQNFQEASTKISEIANGTELYLNIATVNSGYLLDVANSLADQIRSLGINTDVLIYEDGQDFITNVITNRSYDILIYEIELGSNPDLLPYYHSSQASASGLNLSNYKNSLVDDLLLGARETMDLELRTKKYESFLNYWVDETPAIALYQSNFLYYCNKNARAFGDNIKLISPIDRFTNITSWSSNKEVKNRTP